MAIDSGRQNGSGSTASPVFSTSGWSTSGSFKFGLLSFPVEPETPLLQSIQISSYPVVLIGVIGVTAEFKDLEGGSTLLQSNFQEPEMPLLAAVVGNFRRFGAVDGIIGL